MITRSQFTVIQRLVVASTAAALFAGCASHHQGSGYTGTSYYSGTTYSSASANCEDKENKKSAAAQGGADLAQNSSSEENSSVVIPLYKEELRVGKRTVDAGSVRLRKTVKTETVNQPVQIREETITVEREPAGNDNGDTRSFSQSGQNLSQPFQEGETEIRLQREEPVVEKQIVPTGRIVAQKRSQMQERNVEEQVRVDDIAVNRSGDSKNIVISQNLNASAAGGSAESSSESSGREASGHMITDIRNLSSAQASALEGQRVRLAHVQVEQSLGNGLITLRGGEQPIYVHISQSQSQTFQPGQTISLSGKICTQSKMSSQSSLSEQDRQALRGQSFFIEAEHVEAGNR